MVSNEIVKKELMELFRLDESPFEGSKNECDLIREMIRECHDYEQLMIGQLIQAGGDPFHATGHLLFDAFKMGYRLKCREIEEEELFKIHNAST